MCHVHHLLRLQEIYSLLIVEVLALILGVVLTLRYSLPFRSGKLLQLNNFHISALSPGKEAMEHVFIK